MNEFALQVWNIAERQHDVVARWQLHQLGWSVEQVKAALRGLRRVHRAVCALGDLSEDGWYMAAALAMGPTGVVSHLSALMLMGLRPYEPGDVDVSHRGGGRADRPGLRVHRRGVMEVGSWGAIPITSPTQSLLDADLRPHERYRALEQAERRGIALDLPLDDEVRLKRAVAGHTRSDTEAAFLCLLRANGLPLPLVNHRVNGFEADFHWPALRLVVEVDGFEHHRERSAFNEDRRRGLIHAAGRWDLLRVSADHVYDQPALVLRALREYGVRA